MNQSRREFLLGAISAIGCLTSGELRAFANDEPKSFQGEEVLRRIVEKAAQWRDLQIGDLMGKIADELKGTPYQAGTLELSVDREICSANLNALDCVTFFETTLDLARMIKKGGHTSDDLLKEITFTRYRGGIAGDYTSRLHYTSDWMFDNQKKRTVMLLSELPGSQPFTQKVSFMSSHPDSYPQLVKHPKFVQKIKQQEMAINSRALKFVPLDRIASIESLLKTGDIVGVCTSLPGMDIVHTGLIVVNDQGSPRFMHASSVKSIYKVMVKQEPLTAALSWSKTNTGAMFARPL